MKQGDSSNDKAQPSAEWDWAAIVRLLKQEFSVASAAESRADAGEDTAAPAGNGDHAGQPDFTFGDFIASLTAAGGGDSRADVIPADLLDRGPPFSQDELQAFVDQLQENMPEVGAEMMARIDGFVPRVELGDPAGIPLGPESFPAAALLAMALHDLTPIEIVG